MWKVLYCDNGDNAKIIERLKSGNITHALFKIANGVYDYNVSADLLGLTTSLHKAGIEAWGWHYVTGDNPIGEAIKAVSRTKALGLDGYVIDAEAEYKLPGRASSAEAYSKYVKTKLGSIPVALCSYRFPYYHMEFPWKSFLPYVDFVMPQVYWASAHNAGQQLEQSIKAYDLLYKNLKATPLPYFPVGAAYREHGWQATPGEVQEFLQTAKNLGLAGCNFWEYWHSTVAVPELWPVIANFQWEVTTPPVPVPLSLESLDKRLKVCESFHGITN